MANTFNPSLELTKPSEPPIPYPQADGRKKDGTPRKRKWKVHSMYQGTVPANQYMWWYYYGEIPEGYIPIFLDGNAMNTKKDNLELLSYLEFRTMISNSNKYYIPNNPELQKKAIDIIRTKNILEETERSLYNARNRINS